MQINATNQAQPLPEPERRAAKPATGWQDAANFAETDALARKLSLSPDARPDAVERAKDLIAQTDYPPDVTIRGLANLIASKLFTEGE